VNDDPRRWHLGDRTAIYTDASEYVMRCETREAAEGLIRMHNTLLDIQAGSEREQ
jgi:hypothetical protein